MEKIEVIGVKSYTVKHVQRRDITHFIEKWHYSKSINGCISDYCFGLYDDDNTLIGAMFYGRLAMHNQWKRFGDRVEDVTELRRLCCIDNTYKNTESYFIGHTLRWLALHTNIKTVVTYADKDFNHTGVIYKASNFTQLDDSKGNKVIIDSTGKRYHDKAIRTKYKGKLKPFAARLVSELASKTAYYIKTLGKYTYIYNLKRKNSNERP